MIDKLKAADKERVLTIVKDIWEGEDYIPLVFDDWIDSRERSFMGLWKNGVLVGVDSLRMFDKSIGWLEGLRVDPLYQGKGYGRELTLEMLKFARDMGLRELYFSTYFDNSASIKLNEAFGFSRTAVFTNLEVELAKVELPAGKVPKVGLHIPEVEEFFSDSWTFFPPQLKNKKELLLEAKTLSEGRNLAVVSRNFKAGLTMEINYLKLVDEKMLESFLASTLKYASEAGYLCVHTMVPEGTDTAPFIRRGFDVFETTRDVFVYRGEVEKLKID